MAVFKSNHDRFGFYVNLGTKNAPKIVRKKFRNGRYETENPKEIEVLSNMKGVKRVGQVEPTLGTKMEKKIEETKKTKSTKKK